MILQSQSSGADAWLVVAAARSVLALPSTESARMADLAARLNDADGFRATLESLVAGGIASAPPFALLDGDASVLRVVLRGDASVIAQPVAAVPADAEIAFSGAGMATWTERVLEGVASVRLAVPGSSWNVLLDPVSGAEPAPARAPERPPAATVTPAAETTWAPDAGIEHAAVGAPAQQTREEPQADPDSEAYDFLFGDTIYRTQAGASIRIPNPDPERPGDHDGQTMLATDLGRPFAPVNDAPSEATVLATIPPRAQGAPQPRREVGNDPGNAAAHAPSLPLAPTLQLERTDGSREPLSQPVLIGRSPTASGSASDARLIAIADDPDISRTHLRVAVEGDAVVVTDLGSKNGSIITLPGGAPRKLRASEPTVVLPGTLIDLGGGTTFTVRED